MSKRGVLGVTAPACLNPKEKQWVISFIW